MKKAVAIGLVVGVALMAAPGSVAKVPEATDPFWGEDTECVGSAALCCHPNDGYNCPLYECQYDPEDDKYECDATP